MNYIKVLFKKHKKHLPKRLEGTVLGEILKYGFAIFASAWLFQGMLYMNWRETLLKVFINIVTTYLLCIAGLPLGISLVLAHTLNFALNGQLFAMYTHLGATNVTSKLFLEQTILTSKRLYNSSSIEAAIAFGSLSRGNFKSTSDIDIRFVPKKGEINFWLACLFAVKERILAFLNGYPLDLYVFDTKVLLKKMRSDELPIIVCEKNNSMQSVYKNRLEMDEFVKMFNEKVILRK
jgi:predicted nucleotidyltransferase